MITPVRAALMVKVITNTEVDEKESNKGYTKPVCEKQSTRLVSAITTFPTILLHLVSAEIKQRNAANLQSKHSRGNKGGVFTGDCRSGDFQTTSL